MSDKLSGIGVRNKGGRGTSVISGDSDELLKQLIDKVETAENVEELRELVANEELEGISGFIEQGELPTREQRRSEQREQIQQPQIDIDIQDETDIDEQVGQLEQISDQLQLLRQIAASLNVLNQNIITLLNEIGNIEREIGSVIDVNRRLGALDIKDSDTITIPQSNTPRDVVEDDDISTSTVIFKADADNNGSLFIGVEGLSPSSGLEIEPGERFIFPVDVLSEKFQVVSEKDGDEYTYAAFGVLE